MQLHLRKTSLYPYGAVYINAKFKQMSGVLKLVAP